MFKYPRKSFAVIAAVHSITLLLVLFSSLASNGQTQFLYVANQTSNNVSAYSMDAVSGVLTPVAGSPFAAGNGPDTVAVNAKGTFAFVANQNFPGSGSISVYSINPVSGALTPVAGSPFAASGEPYGLAVAATGKFAYAPNLFSNSVSAYAIDATSGALTPVGSPFATGGEPEGTAVDPTGRFVYVPNSETNSISAYTIAPSSGALTPVAGSPFATGTTPQGVANVAFDPAGKFAYVSNQNAGSNVSAYAINAASGALTPVAGSPFGPGVGGSSVVVDPTGKFAYVTNSQGENSVSAYTVDASSGALTPVAGSPFPTGITPHAVVVDPTGRFVYVANELSNDVSAFAIDPLSGALKPVAGSPFAAGGMPFGMAIAVAPIVMTPFARFEVRDFDSPCRGDHDKDDMRFSLNGEFIPGVGSTGIDPGHQTVTLNIGSFSLSIPAGSFKADRDNDAFRFRGSIMGAEVEFNIREEHRDQGRRHDVSPEFRFRVEARDVNLGSQSNPVMISLTIANNTGSRLVKLDRDCDDDR